MKTYKITTSWTGYSEITVKAKNHQDAEAMVNEGNYDPNDEVSTGNGLDYGYNYEEIISTEEIPNETK